MKKIIIIIITVVLNIFNIQAQSVKTEKPRDSVIAFSSPFAKLIVKDLIYGDTKQKEIIEITELLELTKTKLTLKTQLVTTLEGKVTNLQTIIDSKTDQYRLQDELSKSLKKELRAEKRKSAFYKIGTGAGIVAALFLLSQK